jgi:hypothetical protein
MALSGFMGANSYISKLQESRQVALLFRCHAHFRLAGSKVADSASLLCQVLHDLRKNLNAWYSAFMFDRRRDLKAQQYSSRIPKGLMRPCTQNHRC